MMNQSRRSFLVKLGATGLLAATGASATATNPPESSNQWRGPSRDQKPAKREVLGVEVVNMNTGDRQYYGSIAAARQTTFLQGEYEIVVLTEEGDRRVARSDRIRMGGEDITTTVDDGIDLRVETATETTYDYLEPGDPISVVAGAVQRENGIDRQPRENIPLEITLVDGGGNQIEQRSVATNEDGYVRIKFDPTDPAPGRYSVEVTSSETTSTASTGISYGVYTNLPFHWTGMTVGEKTTLGVYSELGGEPEQNVSRDIDIRSPDGTTQTVGVDIMEGGIGMLSFTPETAGRYHFNPVESNEYGDSIGAGELKALAPYFDIRNQSVGGTVSWGAHVVQDKEPVSNLDVQVLVRESGTGEMVDTITSTTNAFGQFTIEIEAPETADVDYELELEAADGRSIFLFGDRIDFEEPPETSPEPSVEVEVQSDDWVLGPGMETPVTVDVEEEGTPVSGATVSLLFTQSWRDVPFGYTEVTTDGDGTATHSLSIPEDVADGEWSNATAIVERNGEVYTDSTGFSIERYDVQMNTWDLTRGETNQIDVTITERNSGDPVSDIDVTIFGNRYNVDTETFDAGYTRTDANGEGNIDLAVPADVTNDIMTNELTPYHSVRNSGGSLEEPFSADISISPENPSPGETIEITYTTDSSASVSAIAVFSSRTGGDVTIIEEGSQGELTVPASVDPGSYEQVALLLLAENGEATDASTSVQVAETLTASFTYDPTTPNAGDTVEFDASGSSAPDGTIEQYEWDFTGDGTVDATPSTPTTTYQYDSPGTYTATLTVEDSTGATDETTQSLDVSPEEGDPSPVIGDNPPTDPDDDGLYEDINGDGEFDIVDVQALYANLESDVVQNNVDMFDFNDDSEVNRNDVQALFATLRNS
jgi:PKD repeat protein